MTFTEERAGHGGLVAMAVQLERRCVGDDSRAAWQLAQRVREGAAALLPALTTLQADFDRLSVLDSDSVSAGDYREHDEHNADVREDIADSAAALAEQIERLLWAAPAEEVSIPGQRLDGVSREGVRAGLGSSRRRDARSGARRVGPIDKPSRQRRG